MSDLDKPALLDSPAPEVASPHHRRRRRKRGLWGRIRRRLQRINWPIALGVIVAVVAVVVAGSLVLVTDATGRVRASWDQLSRDSHAHVEPVEPRPDGQPRRD